MTRTQDGDVDRWSASYRFASKNVYGYYFELTIDGQQYVYQNNNDSIYWTTERGSFGVGQIGFAPSDREAGPPLPADGLRPRLQGARTGRRTPSTTTSSPSASATATPPTTRSPATRHLPRRPRRGARELARQAVRARQRATAPPPTTTPTTTTSSAATWPASSRSSTTSKTLGVNTLYINPIFEAGSNHKYDTADYLHVDDGFGTNEDVRPADARRPTARGIRVILDTSLNHTGSDSVYFDRYANFREHRRVRGRDDQARLALRRLVHASTPSRPSPTASTAAGSACSTLPELTESDSFKDFAFRKPDSVMKHLAGPRHRRLAHGRRALGAATSSGGSGARAVKAHRPGRADGRGDVVRLLEVLPRRQVRLDDELHLPQRGARLRRRPRRRARPTRTSS